MHPWLKWHFIPTHRRRDKFHLPHHTWDGVLIPSEAISLVSLLITSGSGGLLVQQIKGSLHVNQRWPPCSPCRPPPPLLLTLHSCCSVSAVTRLGRLTPAPAGNQITADPNKWLVGPRGVQDARIAIQYPSPCNLQWPHMTQKNSLAFSSNSILAF